MQSFIAIRENAKEYYDANIRNEGYSFQMRELIKT